MEATFTPGPWTVVRSDPAQGVDCWWICAGTGNREKEFGTVYGGAPQHEANARLIASAPDLLHALKELTRCAAISDAWLAPALAAIAKAEGK